MENVYNHVVNDLLSISEQLKLFKSELKLADNQKLPSCDEDIMKILNIDDAETFQKLEESVDLDTHLNAPEDVRVLPFKRSNVKTQIRKPVVEIPKKSLHLNAFCETVKFKKKYYGHPFGQTVCNYRYDDEVPKVNVCDLAAYEDFLISIRIYKPYRSAQKGAVAKPKFTQELLVRGNQFLTELRDKISCECTHPLYDISENPDQPMQSLEADPGFFFITDTFYNDTRNAANPDYSAVILRWAETRPKGTFTTKLKTAKMEETKFVDLKVRLGFPQVYQHFGNCEHLFTFSWIQVICPEDCLGSEKYPILRSVDKTNCKALCSVCGQRQYIFIVRNSNRHMHDPVYLCRICFNSYHYVDGVKIGEFEAYCTDPDPSAEVYELSSDEEDNSERVEADYETEVICELTVWP